MIDRASTKVLPNGAIRYGVYDEAGNFLRYEYIKPEDEPTQEGTPLNKATLLSDAVAALYGLGASAVPKDVFAAIKTLLDGKAKIATGSYTGTGTFGSANKNSVVFPFQPKFVFIYENNHHGYFVNPSANGQATNATGTTQALPSTWNGNTLSWYSETSQNYQLNSSGTSYKYVAIG